jgi:hypothetical protein
LNWKLFLLCHKNPTIIQFSIHPTSYYVTECKITK